VALRQLVSLQDRRVRQYEAGLSYGRQEDQRPDSGAGRELRDSLVEPESEEIRFADRISKDFDFGDYRLSAVDFAGLVSIFGEFCADYFASEYSYRKRPFFSRYISGLSAGCDAFAQDWSRGFGFFHPPVGRRE
jgi:hypothetical protein